MKEQMMEQIARRRVALSVTTDYVKDTGDPSPYLRRIAEGGFSHVHWCHHWNTDFLYSRWEIEQIQKWLGECGLQLLDLHGSAGREKKWASPREHERMAGVELVKNRIEMTARLSGDVTIMHIPEEPGSAPLLKSLDELEGFARDRHVRLAIENGSFEAIRRVLSAYDPGYVGLCYDAGHGNIDAKGLDHLESLKGRLISVHLHDNYGAEDQHNLPFSGSVDWSRLAPLMAQSAYTKCVSMEVTMPRGGDNVVDPTSPNSGIDDERTFLAEAFEAGTRLTGMIDEHRRAVERVTATERAAATDGASRRR